MLYFLKNCDKYILDSASFATHTSLEYELNLNMLLTLGAAWHGALEFGRAGKLDTENLYIHWVDKKDKLVSIITGLEGGYRFFFNQSRWFIDPTFHVSTIAIVSAPALQGEVRIGRVFDKIIALYSWRKMGNTKKALT